MGLLVTFLLGVFILIGALAVDNVKHKEKIELISISVAFGTMIALAVSDLLPEAVEHLGDGHPIVLVACILGGFFGMKILDLFIPEHDGDEDDEFTTENAIHIGVISAIAVILHNIIEGMTVYSLTEDSLKMGLLTALGVGLHNIPMGMIIESTIHDEKKSKRIPLLALVVLSTFIGGLVMNTFWASINDFVVGVLISITLGLILYIVFCELLPHMVHEGKKKSSIICSFVGILVVVVSGLFG